MKVNEIFYSIQGEGFHAGRAAVFVRFSKCNLKCPFCDTDFRDSVEITETEIVDKVNEISQRCRFVVLTGGEPTLQVTASLIDLFHQNGYEVAMESNGTKKPPYNIDWLTISPKEAYVGKVGKIAVERCDELKIVFDKEPMIPNIIASHYYMQPCDKQNVQENREIIKRCVEFVKSNPLWKISLQTQKILNVR